MACGVQSGHEVTTVALRARVSIAEEKMKTTFRITSTLVLAFGLLTAACGEAVDEVTNTVNCASVCDRYAQCFDSDFDVEGCTDRCENEADASENREARLESCNSCIDDRSCTSATFECSTQCAGIVP
jgi:hypothetical protein